MSMIKKIGILFLFLLPMAVAAKFHAAQTEDAVTIAAFRELEMVRDLRIRQLEDFFEQQFRILDLLSHDARTLAALQNPDGADASDWIHGFRTRLNLGDLLLIDGKGRIRAHAAQESAGLQQHHDNKGLEGPLRRLFERIQGAEKPGQTPFIEDMALFPEGEASQPMLLAGRAVMQGDTSLGAVVMQLPLAQLNAIMQQREGMGRTGETYLVGPDKRMRSDSFLDPEGHSVRASLAGSLKKNGMDTTPVQAILKGEQGTMQNLDLTRSRTYTAYAPLEIASLKWGIIAEIDRMEVQARLISVRLHTFFIVISISIIMTLVLLYKGRKGGKDNWTFP